MFEGLLLLRQQVHHLAFFSVYRTTAEVSIKLHFVKLNNKLTLREVMTFYFNHKRADFWLPNLGFFFTFQPP